jgi:hypothetical protein
MVLCFPICTNSTERKLYEAAGRKRWEANSYLQRYCLDESLAVPLGGPFIQL